MYAEAYGALYNFSTVKTTKLCPTGWHVPTDDELSILFEYVGQGIAGNRLKSTRIVPDDHPRWESTFCEITNPFGFPALPSGDRSESGKFSGLGSLFFMWSSTAIDEYSSDARIIGVGDGYLLGTVNNKEGCAVRCIKDKEQL